MLDRAVRIVQVSDLHIGSQFLPEKFDMLLSEINGINPDVIVVTGDVTNEGLVQEYERARSLIPRFRAGRTIVTSGNHDYRNTGYLLFKKHFPLQTVHELGDNVVLVMVGTARPDRNEGEVGYRQNMWLEKTLRGYPDRIKIVAMHHHLIAIPDTGSDQLTVCLLYTSPSPRDLSTSRMPSSA